jgi:hypothetical protein
VENRLAVGATIALAVSLLGGCLPFVSPPAKLSLAGGATPAPISDPSSVEKQTGGVIEFRAALQPLDLTESLHDRRFDLGLGYVASDAYWDTSVGTHGPFLELEYFPWQKRKDLRPRVRWGLRGSADLLFATVGGEREIGFGALAGFGFEYTGFAGLSPFAAPLYSHDDTDSDSDGDIDGDADGVIIGVAHGEWSIGMFAGVEVKNIASQTAFAGLLGVEGRLPIGAGIICCIWSGDDDEKKKKH